MNNRALRQGMIGAPRSGDRVSLVRYATYALATDRSAQLGGPQTLTAMSIALGAGSDALGFHRRLARAIPSRSPDLDTVLEFVGAVEALRFPSSDARIPGSDDDDLREHRVSELARRLLGSSDDRLSGRLPPHWWPKLRGATTWRGPADVLIAADAAISRLATPRELSAWDRTGLDRTLEQLTILMAGGGPDADDAVTHTAVLLRSLYERSDVDDDRLPGSTADALLHSFVASAARFPGTGQVFRAMDRAVRSHATDAEFVAYVAGLFAELTENAAHAGPAGQPHGADIESWFPGSYRTRLVRVLGLYGGPATRDWAWEQLAREARSPGSMSNRRAAAWALMETVSTSEGWALWSDVVGDLATEDAGNTPPEFSAFTRSADLGRGALVARLRAAGASGVGGNGCLDLVTARVRYHSDAGPPAGGGDDDGCFSVAVPDAVWRRVEKLLHAGDDTLRRRHGWSAMNSDTRTATAHLLEEVLLSSSIIRANTARETLLAAGPAVREAAEVCAETLLSVCRAEPDVLPVWFRERVLSLVAFVEWPKISNVVASLSAIVSDTDGPSTLRARALLTIGDLLHARREAVTDRSELVVELSRSLLTSDEHHGATEVWTATVRVLGLLGANRAPMQALVASGSRAPAEVRRMADWADHVLS